VSLEELAARTAPHEVAWREGTKGKRSGHFAWLRVRPAGGRATGERVGAEPIRLLIERQADGKIKYAVGNLPPRAGRIEAVRLWKSRLPVEQGYQQMEEELGPDHFEGRSRRGFHHHACLVMLAYVFLAREQRRARRERSPVGKRGGAEGR
jgi:SRSO17 transposase